MQDRPFLLRLFFLGFKIEKLVGDRMLRANPGEMERPKGLFRDIVATHFLVEGVI